ncbi:MAG: hypothetical protein ACO1SX_06285, partial [Actinomycetota bacterium]
MAEDIPTKTGELNRRLTELLAIIAERQALQAETFAAASASRVRYTAEVEELLARPLPFQSPEQTSLSAAEHEARDRSDFSPTRLLTLQALYQRERAELAEAEASALLVAAEAAPREPAQRIVDCLRAFREITARGANPVSPDTAARTQAFLLQERQWSQERLHEMQSLSPDITEDEAAPLMREGLARSVSFFEAMSEMMEAKAQ